MLATLDQPFEAAGGMFANFRGVVTEATYTAYANKDQRYEGFFLRLLIVPLPGEEREEPLERFYSGGDLKYTVPSISDKAGGCVNLSSSNDEDLQGPYMWRLQETKASVKDTNIELLVTHMMENTDFDGSRFAYPRIDDSLVGLDAFWVDIKQPDRKIQKSRFQRPGGEDNKPAREPTILAPDKVFGFIEIDKLPKATGATAALQPSAVSAELQLTMTELVLEVAADGPVEISHITNALIRRQKDLGDALPNLLTLATVEWLSASDAWTFTDGKVTAK